jgi:low affinity Fe/Cu permease
MTAYHQEIHAMNELFRKFAHKTSEVVGSPWAFILAVTIIVIWAVTGPIFHFSDTWQLVINTGTTIVTFIMVFLIQNTQNRDAVAIHLKLDELIRAVQGARNSLVDLEDLSDEELKQLQKAFQRLRNQQSEAVQDICGELSQEQEEREPAAVGVSRNRSPTSRQRNEENGSARKQ